MGEIFRSLDKKNDPNWAEDGMFRIELDVREKMGIAVNGLTNQVEDEEEPSILLEVAHVYGNYELFLKYFEKIKEFFTVDLE